MSIELATAAFVGMSALSSVLQAYATARIAGIRFTKADAQRAIESAKLRPLPEPAIASLDNVIDDRMLDRIKRRIDEELDRVLDTIDSDVPEWQKERMLDAADAAICDELRRIKRYNGGILPDDEYYKWWKQHRCT